MKKSLFLAMGMATAMASCTYDDIGQALTRGEPAHVCISMDGFDVTTMTRTVSADSSGMLSINFAAIDSTGQIAYSTLQSSKDSVDFGSVSFDVKAGTYTFVATAYALISGVTISSTGGNAMVTLPDERVCETFCARQQFTVTAGQEVNLQMTLRRVTASLELKTTDNVPVGAKRVEFLVGDTTKAQYSVFQFNAATGLMDGFGQSGHLKRSWSILDSEAGSPTVKQFALLLGATSQSLPVTIKIKDKNDELLYEHFIPSVPFEQNCITTITGELYGTTAQGNLRFDTAWGTPKDGGW